MHILDRNQIPSQAQTLRADFIVIMSEWYHVTVFVKFTSKMVQTESYLRKSLIVQTASQQLYAFLVLRALFAAWEAMWT